MGGHEMAPYTPPLASRSSLGLDRSGGQPASTGAPPPVAREQSVAPGQRHAGPSERGEGAGEQHVASPGVEVPVITCAQVAVREAELAGRERDSLVLTAEERRWGRRRVTTAGGRPLVLALPTGSTLVPGAILHVGPDWYVVVEGASEPVLAFTSASREEALRVAFEVGNRHFTLAVDGERLLVPDDPAMDHLLTRMGIRFARERAVFVPIGAGHRHAG
jgi:urease accessory protein